MIDLPPRAVDQIDNAVALEAGLDAGQMLRQAREAAGLHIAALAVMLKVPVKKLEALESNCFDALPDSVFVRALAASVCRNLKIDAAPILARLPQTHASKLGVQGIGINAPFRSPGDVPGPSTLTQISKRAAFAGLFLLLGALALVFLPIIKLGFNKVTSLVFSSQLASVGNVASDSSKDIRTSGPSGAPATEIDTTAANFSSSLQAIGSVTVPILIATPALSAVVNTGAQPASSSALVPGDTPPLSTDVVVFTATGESWVEVADSRGQVVFRRMLVPGDIVGAAGSLPLRVVVGKANVTSVKVRGKSFDLNVVSKDNVARFEVK